MIIFYIKYVALAIVLITGTIAVTAQDCPKLEGKNKPLKTENQEQANYEGWQKIELNSFTFYTPIELKGGKKKCIEGGCYEYSNEDKSLLLGIDINPDANRPTFERLKYPTYSEKFIPIDRACAWLWYFEDDEGYKYNSGVLFNFGENIDYRVGIYLFSKNENVKEMSEKIFKSVKFKNRPSK